MKKNNTHKTRDTHVKNLKRQLMLVLSVMIILTIMLIISVIVPVDCKSRCSRPDVSCQLGYLLGYHLIKLVLEQTGQIETSTSAQTLSAASQGTMVTCPDHPDKGSWVQTLRHGITGPDHPDTGVTCPRPPDRWSWVRTTKPRPRTSVRFYANLRLIGGTSPVNSTHHPIVVQWSLTEIYL